MQDKHYHIIGLVGFIVAGVLFVAVGAKAGDWLTISGSVVWIAACVVWLILLLKP